MRRCYHLPADIALPDGLPATDGQRLTAVVTAAISRAIGAATPGDTVGPPVSARPKPKEWVGPADRDAYAVPSYDDDGRKVRVPRTATDRGAENRKRQDATPPRVRVITFPGQARWRLIFPVLVTGHQVENWLFLGGGLPDGFSLTATSLGSPVPSVSWYLSWADRKQRAKLESFEFMKDFLGLLTPYGRQLANRALLGGDATDEEVAAWEAEQAKRKRLLAEYDRQFVPALGMTRGDAIAHLEPGPYEVNGQFIWIGFNGAHTVVETHPVSSDEVFNRDIRFYLHRGLSVSQAVAAFTAQWDYIFGIELAFAGIGAGYRVSGAGELEAEVGIVERRLARAQGLIAEGDLALAKALSSSESTVIRTGLAGQAEIGAVRAEATSVTPKRGIGFLPQPPAEPPAGYRPVAGFAREREPLSPVTTPPEQQTFTQLPPARQITSSAKGPGTPTRAMAGGADRPGTPPKVGSVSATAGTRDYRKMTPKQLRKIAKTDPDAAYELGLREAAAEDEFNPVARGIAKGHARDNHFPADDVDELTGDVEEVMKNYDDKKMSKDGRRTAYWHEKLKMIVIEDPGNKDGGTVFRPDDGKAYFGRWD